MSLILGDCVEVLRGLEDDSIHAVVTDPPYGINFMGKAWDGADIARQAQQEREAEQLRRDEGRGAFRLTGDLESPERHLIERTGSAYATHAGAAGSYDFTAGRYGDERDWSQMGGPSGRDNTKHSERGGAMRAGRYDLTPSGNRGFQAWCELWGAELLRVLKPGGHALVFGGCRTHHRLACALEEVGFEIRDELAWLFGSGFPKSRDVSKAIDEAAGAEREVTGPRVRVDGKAPGVLGGGKHGTFGDYGDLPTEVTGPATEEAARWQGWGTALKPAHEPIIVARKPLAGTVAANVLEHGTGAINVDGCRVDVDDREVYERNHSGDRGHDGTRSIDKRGATDLRPGGGSASDGRWPANVVLDEEAAELLDEQSGNLTSGANPTRRGSDKFRTAYGDFEGQRECVAHRGVDVGGASRFFYCAKTSRAERNAGLDGFEARDLNWSSGEQNPGSFQAEGTDRSARNHHPTVKPISLMRWLVRLVTPPGGTVLDPFLGSGTTGIAAALEGFEFVGVEREPDYLAIAEARIAFWREHGDEGLRIVRERDAAEAQRRTRSDAGQLDLLAEEAR